MQLKDCIQNRVHSIDANQTVSEAAKIMKNNDIGILPVLMKNKLVGVVTDRDLMIRVIAEEQSPDDPISEFMSTDLVTCYDDQTVKDAAQMMSERKVRRIVVLKRDRDQVLGILSMGDLTELDSNRATDVLESNSAPGLKRSAA